MFNTIMNDSYKDNLGTLVLYLLFHSMSNREDAVRTLNEFIKRLDSHREMITNRNRQLLEMLVQSLTKET